MNTLIRHANPIVVASPPWPEMPIPPFSVGTELFVGAAGRAARLMPAIVHDAVVQFADHGHQSGAMLLRGLPVGSLPATPPSPLAPADKDWVSEFSLLTVARRLAFGQVSGGGRVGHSVPVYRLSKFEEPASVESSKFG